MNLRTHKRRACAGMARRLSAIVRMYPAGPARRIILRHSLWRPSRVLQASAQPDRPRATVIRFNRNDHEEYVAGWGK